MKKIWKFLIFVFAIQFALVLSGCQGWLAPNVGAF